MQRSQEAQDANAWKKLPASVRERSSALQERIVREAEAFGKRVTMPVFGIQDSQLVQDRTGVLIRIAEYHFLVTAAHDLRKIIDASIPLAVPPSHDGPAVRLDNCKVLLSEEDTYDVAVLVLPESLATAIKQGSDFLDLSQVDKGTHVPPNSLFMVLGFPTDLSGVQPTTRLQLYKYFCFLTVPYKGLRSSADVEQADTYLRLVYGREMNQLPLRESKKAATPKPFGVSGCGIWRVATLHRDSDKTWTSSEIKLVAIQHTHYGQSQYVRGTWMYWALKLIAEEYESLQGALELVYPAKLR